METTGFSPVEDPQKARVTWNEEIIVMDADQPVRNLRAVFDHAVVGVNWFVLSRQGSNSVLYYAFTYEEIKFDVLDTDADSSVSSALGLDDKGASRVVAHGAQLPEAALPAEFQYPARNRIVVLGEDGEPCLVGHAAGPEPASPLGFDDSLPGGSVVVERAPPAPLVKHEQVVVHVFYATDRKRDEESVTCAYLGERSAKEVLEFGTCEIAIPRNHARGDFERKTWWRFLFRGSDSYFDLLSTTPSETDDIFFAQVKQYAAASRDRDLFVFIHGFNVSFEDGALRTAQLAYDLGFKGAPILYSWPSGGDVPDYLADVDTVNWSMPHLKAFLHDLKRRADPVKIHLIAHSMGNIAMARCLKQLVLEGSSDSLGVQQVVLAAPDIDRGEFMQLADSISKTAKRVTLYASSEDKALKLSQTLHSGYARAGEAGENLIVIGGVDTIDASVVDTSFLKHSYVGGKTVVSDIFYLITLGLAPDKRSGLAPKEHANGVYWAFQP